MSKRNVIIGAGPAGINAMTTIRELEDETSEITLITDEQAYSRMVLPKRTYFPTERLLQQTLVSQTIVCTLP